MLNIIPKVLNQFTSWVEIYENTQCIVHCACLSFFHNPTDKNKLNAIHQTLVRNQRLASILLDPGNAKANKKGMQPTLQELWIVLPQKTPETQEAGIMCNQNRYFFSEQIILIGFEWWCIFQHVWLYPKYIIPTQSWTLSGTGHKHLFIVHIKPAQKQIYQLFLIYFPEESSDSKPKQYFFSNFQVRDVITLLWLFLSSREMCL